MELILSQLIMNYISGIDVSANVVMNNPETPAIERAMIQSTIDTFKKCMPDKAACEQEEIRWGQMVTNREMISCAEVVHHYYQCKDHLSTARRYQIKSSYTVCNINEVFLDPMCTRINDHIRRVKQDYMDKYLKGTYK